VTSAPFRPSHPWCLEQPSYPEGAYSPIDVVGAMAAVPLSPEVINAVAVKLLTSDHRAAGVPMAAVSTLLRGSDLPGGAVPASAVNNVKRQLQTVSRLRGPNSAPTCDHCTHLLFLEPLCMFVCPSAPGSRHTSDPWRPGHPFWNCGPWIGTVNTAPSPPSPTRT
jgi:hypothetical protein